MELVVNLHLTERCNFNCRYCFAHWDSAQESREPMRDREMCAAAIVDVVAALRRADVTPCAESVRINFVGGEPGLVAHLPELWSRCRELGARVSYVTNGLVFERFAPDLHRGNVDVVGVSIDSPNAETNRLIGRLGSSSTADSYVDRLLRSTRALRAADATISIKVNTVVNRLNYKEDLNSLIQAIRPDRWKVMQHLAVVTDDLAVDANQFSHFLETHASLSGLIVAEDNEAMSQSYLMIDPYGRFFWRSQRQRTGYEYSRSIFEVGAGVALREVPMRWDRFQARYSTEYADTMLRKSLDTTDEAGSR